MKKLLLLILSLALTTNLFAQKKVKGNGKMTTITRTTDSYDTVSCAGSFDYILVAGKEGNITLEGEENILEYIETKVKDGKLLVAVKDGINLRTSSNKTVKITIPFKDIDQVGLTGSGDLWNKDIITADAFVAHLSGSGDMTLTLNTQSADGKLAGSGNLIFKGSTNSLGVSVAGSGDFQGFEFEANHTTVSVSGSGDAEVVSNQSLKARVAGSGNIEYKGNPEKEDTNVAGSGSIKSK